MRSVRTALLMLLLAMGLLAGAAWVASYLWWPQVGFPWPTSGLNQVEDRGFAMLINGRLFIIRQRSDVAPMAEGAVPPVASVRIGDTIPDLPIAMVIDSSVLGTMTVRASPALQGQAQARTGGIATISMSPPDQLLSGRTWKYLGFTAGPVGTPRILVNSAVVTARWTAMSIPLWVFVLLAVPAAVLLFRNRRSVRWAAQGRCIACGYDLRESRDRCPECGRPVPVPAAS